jgi:hypothetical protein
MHQSLASSQGLAWDRSTRSEMNAMPQDCSGEGGADQTMRHRVLLVGGVVVMGAYVLLMSVLVQRSPKAPDLLQAIVSPAVVEAPGPLAAAEQGRLYVPVYSSIAAGGGATRLDLTATLSVRNLAPSASLVIERVDYHDTDGVLVPSYLAAPQTLAPLGTLEVVIADKDARGGTGAKFLVDWAAPSGAPAPLAEAVMIGIYGTHTSALLRLCASVEPRARAPGIRLRVVPDARL